MNAVIAAIVSKFIAGFKGEVAQGSYVVDQIVTLHVKGSVNKGADYTRPATVSIPFKTVLALFVDKVRGVVQENQKDKVFDLLVEAIGDCMNNPEEKVANIKAIIAQLEKAQQEVEQKLIAQLPEQNVSGKTTIGKDWSVEVIEITEKREAA